MIRSVTRWCVVGVMVCAALPAHAAQLALRLELPPPTQPQPSIAPAPATADGDLHGVVHDEQSKPIAGAVVSALGSVSVFAVSDTDGRFSFRALPAGPYLVRAYRQGYVGERGRVIQVTPDGHASWTLALAHLSGDKTPTVLAAGVGAADPAPAPAADAGDDHGEVAWRLRHAPRSVLKDAETALADTVDATPSGLTESLAEIARAVGSPARLASTLFADVPLNGQINFLATGSFDRPQDLFSTSGGAPRIAYVTLAAPVSTGEWNVRGAVTEGDVASWIVAGSFKHETGTRHQYEAGFSYSMQRYLGANPESLAATRDGSRSVGSMYGDDTWVLSRRLSVGYGATYAAYDYLRDRALISPRGSITVEPLDGDPLKLRALVSHRETAPGAEEFLPPAFGVWLPPERTFSSVSRDGFVPERLDHVELAGEREIAARVVVGMRAFRQHVNDQIVTLFGVNTPDAPETNGHYQVASTGGFAARGWGVSISRQVAGGVRASVDYTQVAAHWNGGGDASELGRIAPALLRDDDRVRDLTASVETVVAPTATRVFVVYKLNDGFTAADGAAAAAARFDLQVNQALPFLNFSSARWEMLVAIRTLFHDDPLDGSVYDELLVVHAPRRVIGGVTVRF